VKKGMFLILTVAACLALAVSAGFAEVESVFPDIPGWEPEGEPEVYAADNLFEYINGSAELYLTYDFKEMGTRSYFDDQGRGLTIDIYQHGDRNNAFGIYGQERPNPADFVEIGAQGYYDYGVLNFFRGAYYVKIAGYDLEEFDEEMLSAVAKIVSQRIGGTKDLPGTLACFPEDALVKNSEKFIAANFLGHGFLHSVFVAQYRSDRSTTASGFVIEAEDAADADQMLESYLNFVTEKGVSPVELNGIYRFDDPVSRSTSTINLKKSGSYIWGLSTKAESTADAYISAVETNLRTLKLID
jgi:hypothetical protein